AAGADLPDPVDGHLGELRAHEVVAGTAIGGTDAFRGRGTLGQRLGTQRVSFAGPREEVPGRAARPGGRCGGGAGACVAVGGVPHGRRRYRSRADESSARAVAAAGWVHTGLNARSGSFNAPWTGGTSEHGRTAGAGTGGAGHRSRGSTV